MDAIGNQKPIPKISKTLKPEPTSISQNTPTFSQHFQSSPSQHHKEMRNRTTKTRNEIVGNLIIHEGKEEDYKDDDCVFIKEVTNSIVKSKGKQKIEQIFLEEYPKPKEERECNGTPIKREIFTIDIDDEEDDDIRIINVTPRASSMPSPASSSSCLSRKKRKLPFSGPSVSEAGESSGVKKTEEKNDEISDEKSDSIIEITFVCEICTDSKPQEESFWIKGCSHYYCYDCMKSYVNSKLEEGVSQVGCPVPNCFGMLDPEHCKEILTFEAFVRWGKLLCESTIVATQKFYCPFKDCSVLLLVDDESETTVTRSECPSCFRLFCAKCKVGWHHGIECAMYQTLSKDEREGEGMMLMNLAKTKRWQRCPRCTVFVERTVGCNSMRCRCGAVFCYCCGQKRCTGFRNLNLQGRHPTLARRNWQSVVWAKLRAAQGRTWPP